MARIGAAEGSSTSSGTTVNTTTVSVDFGFSNSPFGEGDTTLNVVSVPWVTASTVFMCQFIGVTTASHDPEDPMVEDLQAYVTNRTPGVSFTLECIAPQNTFGVYSVQVMGVG